MSFFENLDLVKLQLNKFKFIDYPTFTEIIDSFLKQSHYCKDNKITISDDICKALFLVFDIDDSGEIEPEEITIFDGKTTSVSKEERIGNEIKEMIIKQLKQMQTIAMETVGLKWN